MPLEVPFADQQLPYTPKFTPADIEGLPPRSLARGPASAAESALIPPAPGGVAGPHRAIPALPDAGYTAPTLHAVSVGGSPGLMGSRMPPNAGGYGDSGSAFGNSAWGAGSVYGGASVYDNVGHHFHDQHHHGGPMSTIYSAEWAPTSLPAPRGARLPPGPTIGSLQGNESAIAPQERHGHHYHSEAHQHHHHHHHHHEDHGHRRGRSEIDDDAKSDASYYARPKLHQRRSGSSSPASVASSPRQPARRRVPSMSHQVRERSPQLQPTQTNHSPMSPSPLGRPIPLPKEEHQSSPLSTAGDRARRASIAEPPRYRDAQKDKDAEIGQRRERHHSKLVPREGSLSDSESLARGRRHSRSGLHHSRHRSETAQTEYRDENGEDDENGPYKRLNRLSLQADQHSGGQSHFHHHRHRSHSHVPPPVRAASPRFEPSLLLPPASVNSPSLLMPPASYEHPRCRTQSLQGMDEPPFVNPYQAPSVAVVGVVDAYDDGASIAGSAMTFMDGSVGGRVSQYGLPKYAHQPKMDYRRFCVQRGNADVFLD